jgi:hypothetical protein
MNTDFQAAARRHFDDGSYLHAGGRVATADHLYGISVECSLKAVLLGLGHPQSIRGDWPDGYKDHIDVLWTKFQTDTAGLWDAKYLAYLAPGNPFDTWLPRQRYWAAHYIQGKNDIKLVEHQGAASDCLALLRELILDTVI